MAFQRIVTRMLPDGSTCRVYPFHISLEGMESVLLCRDDEDFDHLEKSTYLAARKNNVVVVISIEMSNHGHTVALAKDYDAALGTGILIKKRHSQYLNWKYGEKSILSRSQVDVRYLDSDTYVRNALAYVPRNALDAGARVEDYRWSGYRGMFVEGRCPPGSRNVALLTRRERETLFRSHEDLSTVPWIINQDDAVEPASACDYQYLESAFFHDQAFFLKTIGTVNMAEMRQTLVLSGRSRQSDSQMVSIIADLSNRWFQKSFAELTPTLKARLLPYVYRAYRTSIPQLARCLQLPRETVSDLLSSYIK